MFGESGASAKNCIWSVTLTQRHKKKQFVLKRERKMQGRLFNCARRSTDFHHLRADIGMRRTFIASLAIFNSVRTRHNAPHTSEG